MAHAWAIAFLPRQKKPKFERLLQKDHTRPRVQTYQEQIAAAKQITLMFGGTIRTVKRDPSKHGQ